MALLLSGSASGIFSKAKKVLQLVVLAGLAQSCAGGYEQVSGGGSMPRPAQFPPIELTDFSVVSRANAVQVQWQTAIELGCEYFIIERSADKISFETIGKVPGNDMAVVPTAHQFLDQQPLSTTAYYRLRQVDLDGEVHLGPVRAHQRQAAGVSLEPVARF